MQRYGLGGMIWIGSHAVPMQGFINFSCRSLLRPFLQLSHSRGAQCIWLAPCLISLCSSLNSAIKTETEGCLWHHINLHTTQSKSESQHICHNYMRETPLAYFPLQNKSINVSLEYALCHLCSDAYSVTKGKITTLLLF